MAMTPERSIRRLTQTTVTTGVYLSKLEGLVLKVLEIFIRQINTGFKFSKLEKFESSDMDELENIS